MSHAHARTDLLSSPDEFALLVDAVQDYAMFLLGPTGEIRSWNRGAARILGYTADEIVGHHFSKFYTPFDLHGEKPRHELEIAAAEGRVEDEGWRVRKDGTRFWVNTVITALRDDSGTLVGFAKVTRDLTERKRAEEELRHSEELFRLLVDSVRDYAIFMLDENGYVATWNPGARRIKGYDASDIIGHHFSEFYPPEDKWKPAKELEIARAQGSVEDEGWRLRKDGSRFWANVVITAVHDEAGNLRGFAKVTRDVTERKEAEEMRLAFVEQREARLRAELERSRAEASYRAAQEANRAKDEFLMTLSHELRTPVTAILGWARLIPTIPPSDPTFQDAVEAIGRSAQLQARLIDEVLDVSRIVSGKLRLVRETIDLNTLLRSSVDTVRPTADARSITIDMSLSPHIGELVADPTRLQQVVWNLLTNAVKFTPKGGRVTLTAQRTSSQIEIAVSDTGEGIDPQFLPHVFEPFRQAEEPRTRVHGGLGLGLSIVRYIVEAHGGAVTAESHGRGKGATFRVMLPISALKPEEHGGAQTQDETPHKVIDPQRLAGLEVLSVEDDRETREFIRTVLRRGGAKVCAVDSAAAALEEFDRHPPHLIVTDVAMPGGDGYELARDIRRRENGKDVKIAALTAFPAGAAAAERSGFNVYLTKPIDPFDLVEAVAKLAGR